MASSTWKFEYINEYGSPFCTCLCTQNLEYTVRRPILVYVLIFLRSWLNIHGTYGRVTLSVKVCRCPSTPGSDRPGSDHAKPKSHTKTKGVKFESSHFQGADCRRFASVRPAPVHCTDSQLGYNWWTTFFRSVSAIFPS